jgi:hypothetical protein
MIAPLMTALRFVLAVPAMEQHRPELNTQAAVKRHVSNALIAEKAQGKLAELALKPGLRGSFTSVPPRTGILAGCKRRRP